MGGKMKVWAIRLPEDLDSFLESIAPPGGKAELVRRILYAYKRKWEARQKELEDDIDQ